MSTRTKGSLGNPLLTDEPTVIYVQGGQGTIIAQGQDPKAVNQRTRNLAISIFVFFFCLLLFLLLFFLIPRPPRLTYEVNL
jgi:hypothetical protein